MNLAVTFCRQDDSGRSNWHLGRILDASTGGIRVKAGRALTLVRGRQLDILCLSDTDQSPSGEVPLRIQGRVAWQDAGRRSFGLQYL